MEWLTFSRAGMRVVGARARPVCHLHTHGGMAAAGACRAARRGKKNPALCMRACMVKKWRRHHGLAFDLETN
jgi:hypothetical protein